ncbi:AAA family ATPase [Clostridium sp. P21]|uniref:AAA family ATPase n=1 Tax=Clostridium muellerianum TaxID=2716538 RepID=A0A7Y0EKN8_9CLOT|nr:NB-ARC domain-containing protein [Clostridium muellerianum]NMM65233.1 AAA family ATPase [Clostridium muellerianum]
MKLNLSNRIVMFSICTAIEYDLKNFILGKTMEIDFTPKMIEKCELRSKNTKKIEKNEEILNYLDLGDYVNIISEKPMKYSINNDKSKKLKEYFFKIIPIRNRVMHTKPLELGDKAILIEVMNTLNREIDWINWKEVQHVKITLDEDPSKLLINEYNRQIDYDSKILHNLPEPEFDDTGYIGRKKDVEEIIKLINNKKNQIISIIGNGGIGKTAIVVKALYELIENNSNRFEAIIWISLKTKTLSKGEFIEIKDAIIDVEDVYKNLCKGTVVSDKFSPKENILQFMENFPVLLVLDNLETINTEEMNQFFKDIPEKSKVLITSRLGIGELEYRYKLEGMCKKDSITYFRELSQYYGLDMHKRSDDEIAELTKNKLYNNPLSIKWFMSGIYNGVTEQQLLCQKEKLIEFCMSNVYNKLSDVSKEILQIFLIEDKSLTLGAIDFFMETDEINLKKSINELIGTNMITLKAGKYHLNDMARDYLTLYFSPSNLIVKKVFSKRKKLNEILQEVRIRCENDAYSPKAIFANTDDENRRLASYYLINSLEYSSKGKWDYAFAEIDKAQIISPEYFEIYKIRAFIMAEKGEGFLAINNYKTALLKTETDKEKAIVLYLFAVFYTIKLANYDEALKCIDEALQLDSSSYQLQLEKSRILMMIGNYDSAEEILINLKDVKKEFSLKDLNIYSCRCGELYRRKAEKLETRDYRNKLLYYKDAMREIEQLEQVDKKTLVVITNILKDIAYLFFYNEAMEYMNEILMKYSNQLRSLNHNNIKKIVEIIDGHKQEIPSELYKTIKKYIHNYSYDANNIEDNNKGVVVYIRDYYGFIANKNNKSIYFKVNNAYSGILIGDYVKFRTYDGFKGIGACDIQKI